MFKDEIQESNYHISHPLIRKNSVEFRTYQSNISQSAFNRNTLVILPTALGKTIISLLVCANTLYNYKDKRVLIMAPTRPLVIQHMNSFFSVLKMLEDQIAAVTGKIVPYARRAIWNKPEIRLVFATPEVVKNDIEENRLSLNDFTLLVFDEAHRAVKDYAYTFIAKEYVKQSIYPLILALTASPGSDKQRMKEVCDNLFIEHVEYRSEEDPDVRQYINPIEVEWKYLDLPSEYQYIISNLKSILHEKIRWLIQHRILSQKDPRWIFKRNLIDAGDQIRYNLELTMEEERGPLYVALMQQSSALSLMYCTELIESQGSYSLKAFLDRIEEEGHGVASGTGSGGSSGSSKSHQSILNDSRIKEVRTLVSNLTTEHPKITYIVNLLRNRYHSSNFTQNSNAKKDGQYNRQEEKLDPGSDYNRRHNHLIPYHDLQNNSRTLIFTQYRDSARHIVEMLSKNGINASRFVGQAKRQGDIGMKQDEQTSILESFRNGEFDVLVATSIAEEGLDIPQVDLVIFYEPIPSEIRYIQRRGRTGRMSAGSVIILAAKETIDERNLHASKRRIQKMKQTLSSLLTSLKPIIRNSLSTDPLTSDDISSLDKTIENMDEKLKEMEIKSELLNDTQIPHVTNNIVKIVQNKRKSLLNLEGEALTTNFRLQVDKTARMIHSLLVRSGRAGLDFDSIGENIAVVDNSVVIEALHRLEKLKRIEWLDDNTVVLIDNLKKISGKTYDVYVEKIVQGRALIMVNGKWHARLNHYDYEGPRDLLKKGGKFKAVGELYHGDGVLNLRIKQIV
jgi:Fanconi anemia group M protein